MVFNAISKSANRAAAVQGTWNNCGLGNWQEVYSNSNKYSLKVLTIFAKSLSTVVADSWFWLTEVEPDMLFCYCSPASSFSLLRDTFLLTTVIKSYCTLPVSLNYSGHSHLTSPFNKAFWPTELPLIGCFLSVCFSHHSACCAWNSISNNAMVVSQVTEITTFLFLLFVVELKLLTCRCMILLLLPHSWLTG